MSTRTTALAVDVVSEVADAVSGLGEVSTATSAASDDMAKMGREAEESARRLGVTADSADELGGKAGKATGALGALSSGFELVGAEKYAGALQGAALATDFMSGVGDSLNLVMESTIVKNIRTTAATVARTVAEKAAAAGTAVMTAGQWALNAALSANPIALIVIGVVALVAAVVLAYKKSETFRAIVTGAFNAVKTAATATFTWVKNNWPLLLAIITGPIGLAVLLVVKKWDDIKAAVTATKKWITDRIGEVPGIVSGIATRIKNILTAPFDAAIDLVDDLIDKIKSIKLPHIDLNPFNNGRSSSTSSSSRSSSSSNGQGFAAGTTINQTFNISGLLSDDDAAVVINRIQTRTARAFGVLPA